MPATRADSRCDPLPRYATIVDPAANEWQFQSEQDGGVGPTAPGVDSGARFPAKQSGITDGPSSGANFVETTLDMKLVIFRSLLHCSMIQPLQHERLFGSLL